MSAAILETDTGISFVQFDITAQNARRFFAFMLLFQDEITEIKFDSCSERSLIQNAIQIQLICVNDEKRARELSNALYKFIISEP